MLVLGNDRILRVYRLCLPEEAAALDRLPAQSSEEIEVKLLIRARKAAASLFLPEAEALLRLTRKFEQQIERRHWGAASFTRGALMLVAGSFGWQGSYE